ncbi:MAG: hypothetical protein MJ176_03290 [Treponema sp.]|jgi:hypothetical protein|nr:hypothetical protein [Treponema sp.]
MNRYRITVRDTRQDGARLNPTAHSEIIDCPESALNDMILCIAQERFGYDREILKNIGYAVIEL